MPMFCPTLFSGTTIYQMEHDAINKAHAESAKIYHSIVITNATINIKITPVGHRKKTGEDKNEAGMATQCGNSQTVKANA